MEVNEKQLSEYGRTRAFVACAKTGTKRVNGFVEAIFILTGCALRFGELVTEFLDNLFEMRVFAL